MTAEDIEITAEDGHSIHASVWSPPNSASRVIQIFHGLGEHRGRYARFAAQAAARNMAVVAHDHRGHGADAAEPGYFADENGWSLLSDDGLQVLKSMKTRFPDAPMVLLGHSMGSYIAQYFSMHHGERLDALVLSASTWPDKSKLIPGRIIAKLESWRLGRRGKSTLLNKLGFGDFNRAFQPARTDLDWLSRDPAEVDAYIADPLCGGPYSCGLWLDLMGGLLSIASDDALKKIPASLPMLLTGGAADPVGGAAGIARLAEHYRATGHDNLDEKIYADGRHEMLNETNREEFVHDLLDWIERQLPVVAGR
jgi:alpha-beta hydrolase superfamily lysophospholipase